MRSMRGWIVGLGITMTMCAASQTKPQTPWRVEIATSGGLAGKGIGTYAIASDRTVSVTTMTGTSCSYQATDEEMARFESLLAAAHPESWRASYAPDDRCCDRFEYVLTLETGDRRSSTEWIDDPLPMPADLTKLAEAIVGGGEGSLRSAYSGRCR